MSVGVALVNRDGKILHWCYGVQSAEDEPTPGVEDFGDHWGTHAGFHSFCINWPSRKERKALGDKEYQRTFDQRCVYLFTPYVKDYLTFEQSEYSYDNLQQNVALNGETGEILAKGFCQVLENDGNLFGLVFPQILSSREHKVLELADWTVTEHQLTYVLHLWEGENFLAGKPADLIYDLQLGGLFAQGHQLIYLTDSAWGGYEFDIQVSRENPWSVECYNDFEKYALRNYHFKKFRGKLRVTVEIHEPKASECEKDNGKHEIDGRCIHCGKTTAELNKLDRAKSNSDLPTCHTCKDYDDCDYTPQQAWCEKYKMKERTL
jgi:hypothetical protein